MQKEELTEEQLQLTIQFAEVVSADFSQAATILSSFDWNIHRALGSIDLAQIDHQRQRGKKVKEQKKSPPSKIDKKEEGRKYKNKSQVQIGDKLQSNNFSQIQLSQKENKKGGLASVSQIEVNKFFLSYVNNKYHPLLTFSFNNFAVNLKQSFKEKKHLLVYIHIIDPSIQVIYDREIRSILKDPQIKRMIEKNCILYGAIEGSQDSNAILQLLPYSEDRLLFALFRCNYMKEKSEFVSLYLVGTRDFTFLEWITMETDSVLPPRLPQKEEGKKYVLKEKQPKRWEYFEDEQENKESQVWQQQLKWQQPKEWSRMDREQFVQPSFIEQQQFQQSKVAQKSIVQKQKDFNLMHEQDELYKRLQQSYMRKRNQSSLKHQQLKRKEEELVSKKRKAEELLAKVEGQCSIEVKMRMPDGTNMIHKFSPQHTVEHIFIYVDSLCREHFQQKFSDFDLTIAYSQLVLKKIKKETMEKVFDSSERVLIIVKEL